MKDPEKGNLEERLEAIDPYLWYMYNGTRFADVARIVEAGSLEIGDIIIEEDDRLLTPLWFQTGDMQGNRLSWSFFREEDKETGKIRLVVASLTIGSGQIVGDRTHVEFSEYRDDRKLDRSSPDYSNVPDVSEALRYTEMMIESMKKIGVFDM